MAATKAELLAQIQELHERNTKLVETLADTIKTHETLKTKRDQAHKELRRASQDRDEAFRIAEIYKAGMRETQGRLREKEEFLNSLVREILDRVGKKS